MRALLIALFSFVATPSPRLIDPAALPRLINLAAQPRLINLAAQPRIINLAAPPRLINNMLASRWQPRCHGSSL